MFHLAIHRSYRAHPRWSRICLKRKQKTGDRGVAGRLSRERREGRSAADNRAAIPVKNRFRIVGHAAEKSHNFGRWHDSLQPARRRFQWRRNAIAPRPSPPSDNSSSDDGSGVGTVNEKTVPRPLGPPCDVVPYSVDPLSVKLP